MADIVVLKSGLDVTPVLTQLSEYADDWNTGSKMAGAQSLLDDRWGFPAVEAGVLQLIMGVITEQGQFVGDSELSKPTDAYYRHNKVREILADNGFPELERCGFLSLPVGGSVALILTLETITKHVIDFIFRFRVPIIMTLEMMVSVLNLERYSGSTINNHTVRRTWVMMYELHSYLMFFAISTIIICLASKISV